MFPPTRIICLTEETVETLYLLGEERRIVGISGYVVRPPRARREKPRVSAFTTADVPKILSLKPDLVLTFSDLQADIAATLIRHGIEVLRSAKTSMPPATSTSSDTQAIPEIIGSSHSSK
jgi:iron complex transport system substrate-binding protein